MNPTGHDLADMLFTGAILVLHLAALAGLGYLLGRLRGDRRARTAETLAAMWELHAGDALRRARLAEDQVEHYKAERNAARVEARREFRDQIAAAHAAREGMAEGYRDEIRHLSAQLADLRNLAAATYQPTEDTGEPNPTDHQAPASGALVHPVVGREGQ